MDLFRNDSLRVNPFLFEHPSEVAYTAVLVDFALRIGYGSVSLSIETHDTYDIIFRGAHKSENSQVCFQADDIMKSGLRIT